MELAINLLHHITPTQMDKALKVKKHGSLSSRLNRFLLSYRRAPHTSTGFSPAELLFNHPIRSHLDLLRFNLKPASTEHIPSAPRTFKVGDAVLVPTYNSTQKWNPGHILDSQGNLIYLVTVGSSKVVRHADQLRHGTAAHFVQPVESQHQAQSDYCINSQFSELASETSASSVLHCPSHWPQPAPSMRPHQHIQPPWRLIEEI